jgi:hypothetical protein
MAWKLIAQAFRMIFNNFGQALRVSIGPYVLLIAIFLAVLTFAGQTYRPEADALMTNPPSGLALFLILALVPIALFIAAWVAVSWHRFILLEERAGFLPPISGRPIWGYVGKSILLGLLVLLLAVPVMMAAGLLAAPFMAQAGTSIPVVTLIILAVGYVIIGFVALRLAVSLPGTALGKPMSFGDAWRATNPIAGAIFGVTLILVIINVVPGVLLTGIYVAAPFIGVIVDVALSWLTLMLGIGILTTLYGHLVEGRDLPD